MARSKCRKLHAPADEEPVRGNEEGIGPVAHEGGEGRLNLAAGASVEHLNLQSDSAGSFRYFSQRGVGDRRVARIDQRGNPNGLRHELVQQPQPLGHDLRDENIYAGRVAARPGKAGDKTELDGVFADAEDNRDRRGCSFGRLGSKGAAGRGDHGHATADEVGHQSRQTVVFAAQPMILHRHVFALDVPDFVEAFAKRGRSGRGGFRRPEVSKGDDRHRRLLRTCRERPRYRGAEERDELAASHGLTQGQGSRINYSRSGPCIAAKATTQCPLWVRSGHHPDIERHVWHVCFVPKADICSAATDYYSMTSSAIAGIAAEPRGRAPWQS